KSGLTLQGTILGTLQYMAPEQLEGKDADGRTDIFAFGALVYEMITGKKAFEGKSQVSLIGAILEREPVPVSTLQPASPPTVDLVIKRCLAKDPDDRWQSAGDLAAGLEWIGQESATATATALQVTPKSAPASKLWFVVSGFLLVTAVALAGALFYEHRSRPDGAVVRFSIPAPEKTVFETGGPGN